MSIKKHIFCLEGEYEDSLHDRKTVLPMLQYLEATQDLGYIYRRTATKEEFQYYLEKTCLGKYKDYRFIYLAFHGEPHYIFPSEQTRLSLDDIAGQVNGRWKGKAVHFSSCQTIRIDETAMAQFKEVTGASLVSGYLGDIDFLDGALLDMILAFTSAGYQRLSYVPALLKKNYPELLDRTKCTFG